MLVALAGGPTWTFATGGGVGSAWQEFTTNVAQFVNSPVIRLVFGLLALFLLYHGARRAIDAESARLAKIEKERAQLLAEQEQRASKLVERLATEQQQALSRAYGLTALVAKERVLRTRIDSAETPLKEARDAVLDYGQSVSKLAAGQIEVRAQDVEMDITDRLQRAAGALSIAHPAILESEWPGIDQPPGPVINFDDDAGGYIFDEQRSARFIHGHLALANQLRGALVQYENKIAQMHNEASRLKEEVDEQARQLLAE